jgi:hypothetical protein
MPKADAVPYTGNLNVQIHRTGLAKSLHGAQSSRTDSRLAGHEVTFLFMKSEFVTVLTRDHNWPIF